MVPAPWAAETEKLVKLLHEALDEVGKLQKASDPIIKECPFCGASALLVKDCDPGMHRVQCRECCSDGGHWESESQALRYWNRRAK